MKKTVNSLRLIPVFLLIFFGIAGSAEHARINGDELQKMMKENEKTVIVDVREPELFREEHIMKAINIPYVTAKGRILKELKPGDRIVFVCHNGPMGDELGKLLTDNGYKKVYNLKGGMYGWNGPISVK